MCWERIDTHTLREGTQSILSRANELTTQFDKLAVADRLVEHTSTHTVAGLQHNDAESRLLEFACGDESGEASSDDRNVCLMVRHASQAYFRADIVARTEGRSPHRFGAPSIPHTGLDEPQFESNGAWSSTRRCCWRIRFRSTDGPGGRTAVGRSRARSSHCAP